MSEDIVERLRDWGSNSVRCNPSSAPCNEAADEIERLRQERDKATIYAESLAVALSRHFPHVPQWKPLTGDLIGLLTQIDNMTTGLSPADEIECLRAEKERLREALESIEIYGSDTISGPTQVPDNRKWHRDCVLEMTRRARAALEQKS